MKKTATCCLFSSFFLLSLLFSQSADAGKTEVMYCRPGNGLTMYYRQTMTGHRVFVSFRKANHNVLQSLQPGECMWKSHPMWGDEPSVMIYHKKHTYGFMTQYTVRPNHMFLSDHHDLDYTTKYFFDYVYSGHQFKVCGEVADRKDPIYISGVPYKRVINVKSVGAEANCD
ncbi:MAG: hypothetical protein WCA04_03290 [Geobacteraceae bacterium]